MDKIIALVVTYNRIDKLKICIEKLIQQTISLDKIVIINNNSNDGTTEFLDSIKNQQIVCVNLNENTGGAGGFKKGLETALELGADWIWGMDDDAYPRSNALEELLKIKKIKENANCCFWSNCNNDNDFKEEYKEVKHLMFVGFFFNKHMLKETGMPRGDFFIYYDDIEFSERIQKCGYSIIKVRDSIIEHKDAASNLLMNLKLGKNNVQIVSCPTQNWRIYYWVRNDILRFAKWSGKWFFKVIFHTTLKYIKIVIFAPNGKNFFFKGLKDALTEKSGKLEL